MGTNTPAEAVAAPISSPRTVEIFGPPLPCLGFPVLAGVRRWGETQQGSKKEVLS